MTSSSLLNVVYTSSLMSLYVLDTNTATYAYVVPLLSFVKTSSMTQAFFVFDNVLIKRVDKSVVFVVINVSFPEYFAESTMYC